MKAICGINENHSNQLLMGDLAKLVTPETEAYQELLDILSLN